MDFLNILYLSLIQGFTEFLPISSSAHLVLAPKVFDFADQGLSFDVALHFGTLLAIVSYFRNDLYSIFKDFFSNYKNPTLMSDGNYVVYVFIATIPIGIAGLLLNDFVETALRSPLVIATTTLVFGLFLYYADTKSSQKSDFDLKGAIIVGFFQILALIPGTSRSGITMSAALLLGYDRKSSAKFSFLLSIPVIFLAATFKSYELFKSHESIAYFDLFLAVIFSFLSAYLCVKLFLAFIEKIGFSIFVAYRIMLSIVLFWMYL